MSPQCVTETPSSICGSRFNGGKIARETMMTTHPKFRDDGIPRRCDISLLTTQELMIGNAVGAVEYMGAHPILTDVVVLLNQAKGRLADWLEMEDPKGEAPKGAAGI
jgi:hypothetical protein